MHEMKKRAFVVTVLIILSLITVTVVGAKALCNKTSAKRGRHSISEIISPSSKWEKVAVGSGFMEGINFDRSGNIWMASPPTGENIKVEDDKDSIIEKYAGLLPVGAKFHKDGRLFITDVTGKLYAFDPTT
jgi:gluconolactonase